MSIENKSENCEQIVSVCCVNSNLFLPKVKNVYMDGEINKFHRYRLSTSANSFRITKERQ